MDEHAYGNHLVTEGIISASTLAQAKERQAVVTGRLDTVLLDMGVLTESTVLETLGKFLNTRTVTGVELASVPPEVARMISPRVARRFKLVPFRKEGNRLKVASVEPLDLLVEDELALLTGCMISSFVGLEVRLVYNLARLYGGSLPVPLATVLKRLSGKAKRDTPEQLESTDAAAPIPTPSAEAAEEPAAEETRSEAEPQPAPPRPVAVSELEMDEEDLALFPSLRGAAVSTGTVAAAPPPDELAGPPVPEPAAAPPPQPAPEVNGRKPSPPEHLSPDERLAAAADALQGAEMRDDIADAILDFCKPYYRRRMLLVVRKGAIVGWRAEGEGVEEESVRAISIPADQPSVFLGLDQATSFWLGALPPMPRNVDLVFGLGGDQPRDCVIVPIAVKAKIVCFLYADNMDESVSSAPMGLLRRLIAKAGVAFQVYLLKSKIRLL